MKNSLNFITLLVLFSLFSCQKAPSLGCSVTNPPSSFFFQLKQNGQNLPAIIANNISIAYFDNNIKKYIVDLSPATDYYANQGILTTRSIVLTCCGNNGIKTFYIEYANGFSNDTLYLDYSAGTPTNNCQYLFNSAKFNGQVLIRDSAFKYQPVYVFNKK